MQARRDMLTVLAGAGVFAASLSFGAASRAAQSDTQASYLTWGGFDIPDLQRHYRAKYGENPRWSVFADGADGFEWLRAGGATDVAHPTAEDVPRWRQAGLIQPIDVARLRNWPRLHPRLRDLPTGLQSGRHFFVPWEWGVISIAYRTDLVVLPDDRESWAMLWDPRNKGRIAILDSSLDGWCCAAILAGVAHEPAGAGARVEALLARLADNLGLVSSDPAVLRQGLASGRIVAAVAWADIARSLRLQGVPVRLAAPAEGLIGWACGLVLASGARRIDKAYDLMDGMLEPDVGAYCIGQLGYGHSNMGAFARVGEADLIRSGLPRDPAPLLDRAHFRPALSGDAARSLRRQWLEISLVGNRPEICACAGPKGLRNRFAAGRRKPGVPPS
jgi:spermidine/putrescine transport system substrate-binding protein